jgi:hypothetical protein
MTAASRLRTSPGRHDGSNKPPQEITARHRGDARRGSRQRLSADRRQGQDLFTGRLRRTIFHPAQREKKFTHYKKHPAVAAIPQSLPRNLFKGDNDHRHHQEWLAAIKAGKPELCYSRFAVGAQLTEIMLLGCVALRAGKKSSGTAQTCAPPTARPPRNS